MNWKRFAAFTFAVLAALLLGFQPAWAQATNATGSIEGVVTDPQGGVLPSAKITVTRTDTGQVISLTSSSAGSFSTGPIVPGNYAVRVEAPSFKTYQTSVVAQVGQITTANAKLEVGSSSTVIEVTGTAVSVNTEQAQLSGDLTASQIENLPVNGRNFLDLAQLEPGVQIQDAATSTRPRLAFLRFHLAESSAAAPGFQLMAWTSAMKTSVPRPRVSPPARFKNSSSRNPAWTFRMV